MPISQLTQTCWVLEPEGGPDGEDRSHHDTEAAALSHFSDCYPAEDYPDMKPQAVAVGPCWTVICDGDCGEEPEDDEYSGIHLASRAEAEKFAESAGWIVTRDGEVFCEDDAPECPVADLAVTEPTPGQLTLDGKEVGVPEPALEGAVLARCGHPDSGEGHCDSDMTCPNYIGYCTVHPGGFPMMPEVDCRTAEFQARWRTRKEVRGG